MKPIRLLALSLVIALTASAQNTYPFPSSGSVGIGTTAPEAPLDVNGSIIARGLWSFIAKAPPGYWGFNHENFFAGRAGNVYNKGFSNQALGIFNGSTTAEDIFLFNQNNPDAGILVLKASGNVGIGTANPQVRLDVQQSTNDTFIRSKSTTAGAWFIADSAADGYFGLRLESAGTPKWFLGSYETADLTIKRGNAYDGTELIRFTTAGNVGIGTASPNQKLSIAGNLSVGTTDSFIAMGENAFTGGGGFILLRSTGNYGQDFNIQNYSNTAGWKTNLFVAGESGNVGIGTANPTHKLAVNGTIKAKEVIVETTGWSDYVFADNYALQSLAEVEAHIKTNKHLPGIPSAAEVATQGVSIGDMQARLLAKIEELTLHQIAQEKLLKAQAEELTALRAEVRSSRQP